MPMVTSFEVGVECDGKNGVREYSPKLTFPAQNQTVDFVNVFRSLKKGPPAPPRIATPTSVVTAAPPMIAQPDAALQPSPVSVSTETSVSPTPAAVAVAHPVSSATEANGAGQLQENESTQLIDLSGKSPEKPVKPPSRKSSYAVDLSTLADPEPVAVPEQPKAPGPSLPKNKEELREMFNQLGIDYKGIKAAIEKAANDAVRGGSERYEGSDAMDIVIQALSECFVAINKDNDSLWNSLSADKSAQPTESQAYPLTNGVTSTPAPVQSRPPSPIIYSQSEIMSLRDRATPPPKKLAQLKFLPPRRNNTKVVEPTKARGVQRVVVEPLPPKKANGDQKTAAQAAPAMAKLAPAAATSTQAAILVDIEPASEPASRPTAETATETATGSSGQAPPGWGSSGWGPSGWESVSQTSSVPRGDGDKENINPRAPSSRPSQQANGMGSSSTRSSLQPTAPPFQMGNSAAKAQRTATGTSTSTATPNAPGAVQQQQRTPAQVSGPRGLAESRWADGTAGSAPYRNRFSGGMSPARAQELQGLVFTSNVPVVSAPTMTVSGADTPVSVASAPILAAPDTDTSASVAGTHINTPAVTGAASAGATSHEEAPSTPAITTTPGTTTATPGTTTATPGSTSMPSSTTVPGITTTPGTQIPAPVGAPTTAANGSRSSSGQTDSTVGRLASDLQNMSLYPKPNAQ